MERVYQNAGGEACTSGKGEGCEEWAEWVHDDAIGCRVSCSFRG